MKVAIVHDYLNQYGGAERLLEVIAQQFPDAPIYTSIYDPEAMGGRFAGHDIRTSFMQHLPGVLNHHQPYLPLYPIAFSTMDLSSYDLVLSSSSAWAKGVKTGPRTLHICYCHSPMRFVWQTEEYLEREQISGLAKKVLPPVLARVKLWDVRSAARPNYYIANSQTIAGRIRQFWGREATVINPPVSVQHIPFRDGPRSDFYLMAGRLMPYKRMDVAVQAFKQLDLPLKVAGTGRYAETLKKIAGPKTEFLGFVPDDELYELYNRCRGFIQTGAEDFGITPVEAMAGGAPIISIRRDGPSETVLDGKTGLFFEQQTPSDVIEAVRRFEQRAARFNHSFIRRHAESFDTSLFIRRYADFVNSRYEKFVAAQPNQSPVRSSSSTGTLAMSKKA